MVLFSVVFILFALLVEFVLLAVLHIPEDLVHLIELLDIGAVLILLVDVGMNFHGAKDKKKFLVDNWLIVLSFLPYLTIFRVLRVGSAIIKFYHHLPDFKERLAFFFRKKKDAVKEKVHAVRTRLNRKKRVELE